MQKILAHLRWFFTGLRLFLPLAPRFVWIAFLKLKDSTVDYWKNSQSIVDEMANEYMSKAPLKLTSDYDPYPYWACYSIATLLYLLGWLAMAWLTVEVFLMLISLIF